MHGMRQTNRDFERWYLRSLPRQNTSRSHGRTGAQQRRRRSRTHSPRYNTREKIAGRLIIDRFRVPLPPEPRVALAIDIGRQFKKSVLPKKSMIEFSFINVFCEKFQ